jgi:hypothetical protein
MPSSAPLAVTVSQTSVAFDDLGEYLPGILQNVPAIV